jgi:hypothetical protein
MLAQQYERMATKIEEGILDNRRANGQSSNGAVAKSYRD